MFFAGDEGRVPDDSIPAEVKLTRVPGFTSINVGDLSEIHY